MEVVKPTTVRDQTHQTPLMLEVNRGEDASRYENRCWVPEFTTMSRAGFDKSLTFLGTDIGDTTMNVALALARNCTAPRDVELLGGTSLDCVCNEMMSISMGLVTAISRVFEKVKALRKKLDEQKRNLSVTRHASQSATRPQ